MPKDSRSTNESNEVEIAVVGGGIAGLYCCYQLLKKEKRSIRLYEASNRLGGRIETWSLEIKPGHGDVTPVVKDIYYPKDLLENPPEFFRAEFGPMRIEPKHQPFLKDLLKELGIAGDSKSYDALIPFSSYKAEEPTNPKFTLTGEEAEQHSLLDLLLLAIRRIFEMIEWPT